MNCLKCASESLRTLSTLRDGAVTKRVKQCRECDFVFPTIEKACFENYPTKEEISEYEEYINKDAIKE